MDTEDAKKLLRKIRRALKTRQTMLAAESLWRFRRGDGYKALGYDSLRSCFKSEKLGVSAQTAETYMGAWAVVERFGIPSKTAYRLSPNKLILIRGRLSQLEERGKLWEDERDRLVSLALSTSERGFKQAVTPGSKDGEQTAIDRIMEVMGTTDKEEALAKILEEWEAYRRYTEISTGGLFNGG